jgi:hypothetical protein
MDFFVSIPSTLLQSNCSFLEVIADFMEDHNAQQEPGLISLIPGLVPNLQAPQQT